MSGIKRVIVHWAVTRYKATELSKKHYHYIVEGDGTIVKGHFPVEANIKIKKGEYAAHTLNSNTGSASVACAAMFGAKTVDDFGKYPITEKQFKSMARIVAELCIKHNIFVTKTTVLSHAEVQDTLGIKQRGKWDIAVLPFANLKTAASCGDYLRKAVKKEIALQTAVAKPADKALSTKAKVASGAIVASGCTLAVFWDKVSAWFGSWF